MDNQALSVWLGLPSQFPLVHPYFICLGLPSLSPMRVLALLFLQSGLAN